ncbi:surface antigen [Methylohalomonas lacus]|uniref:Surface antigen n=1 Tax=Methylohalomonas lacus TaxID=398773 RepID=A0AAE3HJL8_9GAMM|nr:RT0821/Lpp0805 family surface protein [Methylohalomonas lacus]MCS3902326.1 surface antigen [Methylohalomonas lacus]
MKIRVLTGLLASALVVTACNPTKQDIGTVAGAGAGAAVGSQIGDGTGQLAAVAIGTLVGGYIGGSIGKTMDDVDRMKMNQALEKQPTGRASTWENPDTGHNYSVTPTETYQRNDRPCRDYTTEAVIDGQREVVHGTACRESDGRWVAQN